MQVPLEMAFRGVPATEDVEREIRGHADKLDRLCDDIVRCRVTVERRQQHQRFGNPFTVRVEVTVPPGKYLVATQDPADTEMHVPLPAVVRRAFEAMERQLGDLTEVRRGEVKEHDVPRAIVIRLFPEEGYGFLKTPAGREIYFHRNSVLHQDFDRLRVGSEVRFEESMGEQGPQATTVQLLNRPAGKSSLEPGADVPRGWR